MAGAIRPTASAERIAVWDVLRGTALGGVLMVNLLHGFRVSLFESMFTLHTHSGWANRAVDLFTVWAFEFKAFTLLSFLFGVGLGLQMERFATYEVSASRFLLRRLLALLGIGMCHMLLVWNGDILALYAVCGMLLIPLIAVDGKWQAIIGAAILVLSPDLPLGGLPPESALRAHAVLATRLNATGTWTEVFALRLSEAWDLILPLLIGSMPRTLGLMLMGLGAWRTGFLRTLPERRSVLMTLLVAGGSFGALTTTLHVWFREAGLTAPRLPANLDAYGLVLLSFAYAAGLLLCVQAGNFTRLLGAAGRMALSNYLMQSIIFSLLFYGFGLGLSGRLSPVVAALVGIAVFAAQLKLSAWWLRRFCFGPAEWLWRSLTYARWQPLAIRSSLILCSLVFGLPQAEAQSAACRELNQTVVELAGNGQLGKAELALSAALKNQSEPLCTGVMLTNLAAIRTTQGRHAEAEMLSQRSLGLLEEHYPTDSRALLRPLHILAVSRFEQGKVAKTREVFRRMRLIRLDLPEDAALVHGAAAVLLEVEGKLSEAEPEYLAAIRAWDDSGHGDTADAGSLLHALASLYLRQERLDDAKRILDLARGVFLRAKDAVAMDRIKFLNVQAGLHFRQGEWNEAEQDLREAVSMAGQEPRIAPANHAILLAGYAQVLRKNHDAREARRVEKRLAALRRSAAITDVVDVSELLSKPKPAKRGKPIRKPRPTD
jgi:uncharacterized protein